MKKLLLLLIFPLFLGSTTKYEYKYEIPYVAFEGINDSIPTMDKFGRIRNGIIAQKIIDTLNTDPSGVDLTRAEQDYIRAIVGGLYVTGMWQKSSAIYGFVGGNAFKHKWNWKDLRDLDAANRLVYVGGITHSSLGITSNGLTGSYANTFINPSVVRNATTGASAGFYETAINTLSSGAFGSLDIAGNSQYYMFARPTLIGLVNADYRSFISIAANTKGFKTFGVKRTTLGYTINNGIINNNISLSGGITTYPNNYFLLFARNESSSTGVISVNTPTNHTLGFMFDADFLTTQQAISSSQVITYSQGVLGRK